MTVAAWCIAGLPSAGSGGVEPGRRRVPNPTVSGVRPHATPLAAPDERSGCGLRTWTTAGRPCPKNGTTVVRNFGRRSNRNRHATAHEETDFPSDTLSNDFSESRTRRETQAVSRVHELTKMRLARLRA